MSQWRQTKHGFACWQSYDPSCSISSLIWSVNMAIVLALNCCCMGCKCYQLIWTTLSLDLLPGIPAWNQVIFRECNWIWVVPKCNVQRATLNSFWITKSWSNEKLLILTLRSCIKGGLYLDGEVRSSVDSTLLLHLQIKFLSRIHIIKDDKSSRSTDINTV